MAATIAQLVPLAVGVLASPLPIMAVVLLLLGDRARASASAFVGGWVVGLLTVGLVGVLILNETSVFGSDGSGPTVRVLKAVLGVALLVLALLQWRKRPRRGEQGEAPNWMAALVTFPPAKAFGLGWSLAAIKPKNLVLTLAAATTISESGMQIGRELLALSAFILIASPGVAAPLVTYFAMGDRATATLERWGRWLTQHNASVVAIVLLVIGLLLVGAALGEY